MLLAASLVLLAVFHFAASQIPFKSQGELKGVVLLDAVTFPILVPSEKYSVVLLIANKAQIGDYGTDSIRQDYFAFAQFSQTEGEAEDILFAQILVNGAENLKLATTLGLEKDFKHPAMFVFPKGSKESARYPAKSPYHIPQLVRFLGEHTNYYYKYPGTIREFDNLAKEFVVAESSATEEVVLQKAIAFKASLATTEDKDSAEYYIKTIQRVIEKGDSFIDIEINRLTNVLADPQTSKAVKNKLQNHSNVLKVFQMALKKHKGNTLAEDVTKVAEL